MSYRLSTLSDQGYVCLGVPDSFQVCIRMARQLDERLLETSKEQAWPAQSDAGLHQGELRLVFPGSKKHSPSS